MASRYTILLALVVVLLILCVANHAGDAARHLPGFWVGEADFLQEGGLEDMYLYIQRPCSTLFDRILGKYRFDAFIFMTNSSGIICNQALTLRAGLGHGLWRSDEYTCRARLDLDEPDECPLLTAGDEFNEAGRVRIAFSPVKGTLAIYDDDQLLAYLVKDCEASAQVA